MKILILIELRNRDVYPLLYFGKKISSHGHEVRYSTYKNLGLDTLIKSYDLLVINGVSNSRNISKQIVIPKLRGKKVVCYYSEQLPGSNLESNIFERFRNVLAYSDWIDHHLVWGSYGQDKLIECGVDKRKITLVGSANYSFMNSLKNHSGKDLGHIVNFNDTREMILVADNVFPCPLYGEKYGVYRKKLNDLIVQLAQINEDKLILVRPHPSMLDMHYDDLADLLKCCNIQIRGQGHMAIWLKLATTVLFTTSTSGLEAYFMGKNVASLDIQLDKGAWQKGALKAYTDMIELSLDISRDSLLCNDAEMLRIIDKYCYPRGMDFESAIGLAFSDIESIESIDVSISLGRKLEALRDVLKGGYRDLKKRWRNDIIIDSDYLIDSELNLNQIMNEINNNK